MNRISDFIQANLERLNANHPGIAARGPEPLGDLIDRINNGMSKMSVELDNGDFDASNVTPFANPFRKQPIRGLFQTADGSLQLEVI